ncbi:hypothetical protein LJK88_02805 [Paenibacillus sp. P26]|nr:hypothetical protein LJK88_02805 [Paenibacillus sp. P26]
MILYPPATWSSNEWFVLICNVIVWTIVWLLPKRFTRVEKMLPFLFNFYLGVSVDLIIGVKPYDWYDVMDLPKTEIFDIVLYATLYPVTAYLVLYLYDFLRPAGLWLWIYLAVCAVVTTGLEGLSVIFDVFTYKGWKLPYSLPVYFVIYWLNVGMLQLVRHYLPSRQASTRPIPSGAGGSDSVEKPWSRNH